VCRCGKWHDEVLSVPVVHLLLFQEVVGIPAEDKQLIGKIMTPWATNIASQRKDLRKSGCDRSKEKHPNIHPVLQTAQSK